MNFESLTRRQSNAFCNYFEIDGYRFLLDCGWDDALLPSQLDSLRAIAPTIHCVLISHASLYHIGALPYIIDLLPPSTPIFTTPPVRQLSQFILKELVHCNLWDSEKIISISKDKNKKNTKLTYKNIAIQTQSQFSDEQKNSSFLSEMALDHNSDSKSSSTMGDLSSLLHMENPPTILPYDPIYTAHPYNFDTIERVFLRINDVHFNQETHLKPIAGHAYQHNIKIKCAPAGRTLGGAIWYISQDNDEVTYIANINHQKEHHVDRFTGLKQYTSNKLMIIGNKSYEMRPYPNFLSKSQWFTLLHYSETFFNQQKLLQFQPNKPTDVSNPSSTAQSTSSTSSTIAPNAGRPLTVKTDTAMTYQDTLQSLYGSIQLTQRDQRHQAFLDYIEYVMSLNKGSIFLPVQETVRIIEILCLLDAELDELTSTKYPVVYVGEYASDLLDRVRAFMVQYSSKTISKEKNPYSFSNIRTAKNYSDARKLVRAFYQSNSSSGTYRDPAHKANPTHVGSAIYISAVETSAKHGPTAELFRAILPYRDDTILLTEIPFMAYDPYVSTGRRLPYPEGSFLSFLFHHSHVSGLQYALPTVPSPVTIPSFASNPELSTVQYPNLIPTTHFTQVTATGSNIVSQVHATINDVANTIPLQSQQLTQNNPGNVLVVGTGMEFEFQIPPRPRQCTIETIRPRQLNPDEQKLLRIAWAVSLQLEYSKKKSDFILQKRQQATRERFLRKNYSISLPNSGDNSSAEHELDLLLGVGDDDDGDNKNSTFDLLFEEGSFDQNSDDMGRSTLLKAADGTSILYTLQHPSKALMNTLFGPNGVVIKGDGTQPNCGMNKQKIIGATNLTGNSNQTVNPQSSNIRKHSQTMGDDNNNNNNNDNSNRNDDNKSTDSNNRNNPNTNHPNNSADSTKRFKSTTLELFPTLDSDLYVKLCDDGDGDGDGDDNDQSDDDDNGENGPNSNNDQSGSSRNNIDQNGLNFLSIGRADAKNKQNKTLTSTNQTNNTDTRHRYDDLNTVPKLHTINDVFGLSLNLESLLSVVEHNHSADLSAVLKTYKNYKIQQERNTLTYFELQQAELLHTPCPMLQTGERCLEAIDMNSRLITIPMTTYTDNVSMSNFIQQVSPSPQRIILFKGNESCLYMLQRLFVRETQIQMAKIVLSQPFIRQFLSTETNITKFILHETLLRSVNLSVLTDNISIAPIRAQIVIAGPDGVDEHGQKIDKSDKSDHLLEKTDKNKVQLPLLTLPDQITDSSNIISGSTSGSTQSASVFLGKGKAKVTLTLLKEKLNQHGISAELYRGWLICGSKGKCVVRKDNERFLINGAMCEDTLRVREVLYDQFEIL
jgi:Cft2 family RNA processing exonuclease